MELYPPLIDHWRHWFLVTEFLSCFWSSKVNPSFLGLRFVLSLQGLCLLSPRTVCMSRPGSGAAMALAHKLVLTLLVQNANSLSYLSKILAKP